MACKLQARSVGVGLEAPIGFIRLALPAAFTDHVTILI
jgi:hypothetical protein